LRLLKETNQMTTPRKPYSLASSQPLSGSEWTAINQLANENLLAVVAAANRLAVELTVAIRIYSENQK
jgi:hypothetical protein